MRNFNFTFSNPPYNGSLHLKIFERLLDRLSEKGQMTIIEPATWLINVRKYDENGKYGKNVRKSDYKLIENIKAKISGHVKKVVIENLNKEFNIENHTPLSITYVDFSHTYDTIEFECCGEKKLVKSIYDCNLIGNYDTIWSILNKVLAHGDMMSNHTTKQNMGNGMWYAKYMGIVTCGCDTQGVSGSDKSYINNVYCHYYDAAFDGRCGIEDHPLWSNDRGGNLLCDRYENGKFIPGKVAENIYGTKAELETWKHFIFNNKLPLFINIVMMITPQNCSKEFLPWLVDKQYTDEEIYAKFNMTKDEIALIDKTLKKFERNSPWFKRYMCGPDA